jgi:hypothetical protein
MRRTSPLLVPIVPTPRTTLHDTSVRNIVAHVLTQRERDLLGEALDACVPGATALGAVDYVETLLTALDHDPPRIWAAPPGSGAHWLDLGPWERHAWAQRIEGWRGVYERVLAGMPAPGDDAVVHAHACEAAYGDPAYGGNRDEAGWTRIGFPTPQYPPARDRA